METEFWIVDGSASTRRAPDGAYVLRQRADHLDVGRVHGDAIGWFPEQVPLSTLPPAARDALGQGPGPVDDEQLLLAARNVATAMRERGG